MSDIFSVPSAWRARLSPASFRNAFFHCEANARESGRRIVEHEFPKKDDPYAEDMGRHAREFTIRGYCIVFGSDRDDLFRRDYTQPRDKLIKALELQGPGALQLPTQPVQKVVCVRYRLAEDEKTGGYCTFDMTFQEYGIDPNNYTPGQDTAQVLTDSAQNVETQTSSELNGTPAEQLAGGTAPL
jgi:prophage DNA circulation protein